MENKTHTPAGFDKVDSVVELTEAVSNHIDSIGLYISAYRTGGVSMEVHQQAKQLHDSGYDVTIYTLDAQKNPPEGVELVSYGSYESFYLEKINHLLFPARIFKMTRCIRDASKEDFLIIHRYPFHVPAYLTSSLYDVPYAVWHYHVPDPEDMTTLARKIWMYTLEYFEEKSIFVKGATVACSISESSQQILKSQSGKDSVIISNSTENRLDDLEPDFGVFDEFDIDEGTHVSVFVGRVAESKNIHELIEIFEKSDLSKNRRLIIVGKPSAEDYRQKLQELASSNVVFTGFVTDEELAAIYERADLFVTASKREGRNLPPLEAQSFGVPVLGFDAPGIRDVVRQGELASDRYDYQERWEGFIKNQ